MAHNDRMEYFVTNNAKAIMYILIRYELLESNNITHLPLDYLFQYENVGFSK